MNIIPNSTNILKSYVNYDYNGIERIDYKNGVEFFNQDYRLTLILKDRTNPYYTSIYNQSIESKPEKNNKPVTLSEKWNLETCPSGRFVKIAPVIEKVKDVPKSDIKRGDRGYITEFTPRSKANLKQLLFKLDDLELSRAQFITLTYEDYQPTWIDLKKHLYSFSRVVKKIYPDVCLIWKKDRKKDFTWHLHLLGLGLTNPSEVEIDNLKDTWSKFSNYKGLLHIEQVKNVVEVRQYMLNENNHVKSEDATGAFWGKCNEKALSLYMSKSETVEITGKQAAHIRRIASNLRLAKSRQYKNINRRKKAIVAARNRTDRNISTSLFIDPGYVHSLLGLDITQEDVASTQKHAIGIKQNLGTKPTRKLIVSERKRTNSPNYRIGPYNDLPKTIRPGYMISRNNQAVLRRLQN
jgi:hypothetical protein